AGSLHCFPPVANRMVDQLAIPFLTRSSQTAANLHESRNEHHSFTSKGIAMQKPTHSHLIGVAVALTIAICSVWSERASAQGDAKLLPIKTENIKPGLSGKIQVDGSSTVYKISQLAAEEFSAKAKNVELSVSYVGTGGGFKSFPDPLKKLDICDASRPIQQKELEECVKNGVKFLELPIGIDAITIVVSVKNDFIKEITLAELEKLWAPGAEGKGDVTKWSQVREGWPDEPVALFGADTASGTFEYFNEAVHH